MTSFAETPGRSLPVSSNRIDSGTAIGVKPQWSSAAYSICVMSASANRSSRRWPVSARLTAFASPTVRSATRSE